MTIHLTNGQTQQIPLASLSKMFFSENDATGIATVQNEENQIIINGSILKVTTKGGAHIIIYTIGGEVVKTINTTADETEVNLSGMKKGVYIVKVNNETRKIMNTGN